MKAKFIHESLNEANTPRIKFIKSPRDLREKYPKTFGTRLFGELANEIQIAPPYTFIGGKLDLYKFYNYFKVKYSNYTFEQVKKCILEAAPILGIVKQLRLTNDIISTEEKRNLSFQEKYVYNTEESLEYYDNAEIPASEATLPTDFVMRSVYGETETAYYRFDKSLSEHERNLLKLAYAYKYGDPQKTPWKNYLDVRPATLGHIQKFGKNIEHTREFGDFREKEYN